MARPAAEKLARAARGNLRRKPACARSSWCGNRATAPRVGGAHAGRLAPVLAELGDKGQQGATRWERFKRWLKDKLENRKEDDDDEAGSRRSRRQFETSEGVAQFITYTGYGLVGVLVCFVIWTEVRAAGLFGGVQRAAARRNPAAEWRRRLLLADVAQAPLAERPGMLLRLLGEALTRAQRLPAADGLTAARDRARARGSIRRTNATELRARRRHRRGGAIRRRFAARRGDRGSRGHGESAARKFRQRRAGADARTRHRIPAGVGRARRVLRPVVAPGALAGSGCQYRAAHHRRTPRQWLCRRCTNGCSAPGVRCVRCANDTHAAGSRIPPRGNLLILTLPAVEVFHSEEFSALDRWVRRGNTLLIMPRCWTSPVGRARPFLRRGGRDRVADRARVRDPARRASRAWMTRRSPSACARPRTRRDAKRGEEDEEDEDEPRIDEEGDDRLEKPATSRSPPPARMRCCGGVNTSSWTRTMRRRMVLAHALRQFRAHAGPHAEGEGALFEQRLGAGTSCSRPADRCSPIARSAAPTTRRLFANIVSAACRSDGVVLFDDLRQGLSASYDPALLSRPAAVSDGVHRARPVAGVGGGLDASARARRRRARPFGGRPGAPAPAASSRARWPRITRRCGCSIISSTAWRARRAARRRRHRAR